MSHEPDTDRYPVDPDVRDAYRASAVGEAPSPQLDAAILAAAAAERPRRLHGYLPPLAMAATVVLALGLVLRLAVPPRDALEIEPTLERTLAPRVLEDSAQGRASSVTSDMTVEELPAPAGPPTANVVPESAGATPEIGERRLERLSAPPDAAAAEAAAELQQYVEAGGVQAAQGIGSAAIAPPGECAADDGQAWIACIEELIAADRLDDAADELDALGAAFPDLAIPDTITDALQR